ncbi:hypothetical protein V8F20_003269 [Naviculisporaceae sp. PSN 640]
MAHLSADYIVVGGGLTGCTIASRLSKSPLKPKVLLIEAGSDPSSNEAARTILSGLSLLGSEYDYILQTSPDVHTANRTLNLNVGKVLGGGSILNFGGWLRADAGDYNDWAALVGDERWNSSSFSKLFDKIETFHDKPSESKGNGPMHVFPVSSSESGTRKYLLREPMRQAWESELGVKSNTRKAGGSIAGLTEFYDNTTPEGLRQPSYTVYPLDDVQVLTSTTVSRILFDDSKIPKVVTGVELSDGRTASATKEVILCAGAYHTPKILLLSGIGPSETLGRFNIPVVIDSPHVGQNLHDHFALFLAYRLRDPTKGYALTGPETPPHPFWAQNPSLFKYLPWDWVISEALPPSFSSPTTQDLESESAPQSGTNTIKQQRPAYEILPVYCPPGIPGIPIDGTHIATSTMLLRPTSRGSVTLRSSDASDPPVIQTNFLSTKFDIDTLVYAARRTLTGILGTKALSDIVECESPPVLPPTPQSVELSLKPLSVTSTDEEIEERIRLTGAQHAHPGGTVAMGKVVDTEGKVFGVEKGLRVADSSILPFPMGGHPQATLYAVAEQIAEMILQD